MTIEQLQQLLNERDDGVLKYGAHKVDSREFCVLEFDSIARGREFSDTPNTLPDLRSLNDGPWSSDLARTEALLPVMVALWDWSEWTQERRVCWAQGVALATVREIVSGLPGLPGDIVEQCKQSTDLKEAIAAAWAAAWAAGAAEVDTVLQLACHIWIRCAEESGKA